MDPLRVTMDVGPAVHQGAGLSKYAERLAAYLLQDEAPRVDLTLFYNAHSGHGLPSTLSGAKVQTIALNQLRWRFNVLQSQLLRRRTFNKRITCSSSASHPMLYHASEHLLPYLRCPTVMTVHDLIFERYPEHHTRRNRLFLKLAMPIFVRAADAIIAVSQATRQDLIEFYDCPPAKIHVIYEGIDDGFVPASPAEVDRVCQDHGIQRPYLFMMGTLEPRKNHATALQALARLKAEGWNQQLVVTGGQGWLFEPVRDLVAELGLIDDVVFTGYVPQADVPALYSGADCLLMPSLYEGFGFPVLESMACGTPVVCSDASSLPEVAGDAALIVAPNDEKALAARVAQVLSDDALATTLRERGLARAAQFTWNQCASDTADLYVEIAGASLRSSGGVHA